MCWPQCLHAAVQKAANTKHYWTVCILGCLASKSGWRPLANIEDFPILEKCMMSTVRIVETLDYRWAT